ncbi:hypothetical protein JGU71_20270 [Antrihabitans sp. YC3-6]|uniref:Uncharacterized protein n=1 Tax=Antrihabitans stalagmiti TaxID=2799499 RepID=A0A934NU60_9NOCA|nr:hypothetical protein [Antrihabitans stalagmiti]MBJ8341225.1 hypothetical protein [Antrihabitans stalagmiti]
MTATTTLTGPPWHERTSTVVGASIAGLIVLGILFLLVSNMQGRPWGHAATTVVAR